jgi:hypothetical protein
MRITVLLFYFFLLLPSCMMAQGRDLPPGIKRFTSRQMIPPDYYLPDTVVRFYAYDYNRRGLQSGYLFMAGKDTVEYTQKEWDDKGRIALSVGKRTLYHCDSVVRFRYNANGNPETVHSISGKINYEFYSEKRKEYIAAQFQEHVVASYFYDAHANPVKTEYCRFSIFENDTVIHPILSTELTEYQYDNGDNIISKKTKPEYFNQFDFFETASYGPFGQTSWRSWDGSGYNDTVAGVMEYDKKGRRLRETVSHLGSTLDVLQQSKKREIKTFFYDPAGKLYKTEIAYESPFQNPLKLEYYSPAQSRPDSIIWFEDSKAMPAQINLPQGTAMPPVAYEDGFEEAWRPGSKIEYDKEGRLVKLYFNLDGFGKYFEYEWSGQNLVHKTKFSDPESRTIAEDWIYTYEFY